MAEITTLVAGRAFLEGPRWRDGALYVSDMHGDAVLSVSPDGQVSTVVEVEQPSGLGWLPDGDLLVVSMTARSVLRFDGTHLTQHADLSAFANHEVNDMLVDPQGRAFIGQFGFDFYAQAVPASAALLRVDPDGRVAEAADDMHFANGMVLTADGSTLLVAETMQRRITAFRVAPDGTLDERRVWAELEDAPDGIAIDAEDAVWVASPLFDRFVRVVEGGQVTATIATPGRHGIACELGGVDGRTLFMLTATTLGGRDDSRRLLAAAIETATI
jgi:sugar lactone lactonase YvrE